MNKGQSLFEVVLALFIAVLVLVSIVILSTKAINNAQYSKNRTLASRYTEEAGEWLRNEQQADISSLITKSGFVYCLTNLNFSKQRDCTLESDYIVDSTTGDITIFKRNLTLTSSQVSSKTILEALFSTSWTDSSGVHQSTSTLNFNDPRQK